MEKILIIFILVLSFYSCSSIQDSNNNSNLENNKESLISIDGVIEFPEIE